MYAKKIRDILTKEEARLKATPYLYALTFFLYIINRL